jgi:hypothetical protein
MSERRNPYVFRRVIALVVVLAMVGAGGYLLFSLLEDEPQRVNGHTEVPDLGERTFASDDPVERGCDLRKEWLGRIWRGHDPKHSEDITIVPLEPNYSGGFNVTSHSGPWDYLQTVPLVFYGPGHVEDLGPLDERASITDVYPTVGALLDVPLEPRQGEELTELLVQGASPPRLVVVVVWDSGGRTRGRTSQRWRTAAPRIAKR